MPTAPPPNQEGWWIVLSAALGGLGAKLLDGLSSLWKRSQQDERANRSDYRETERFLRERLNSSDERVLMLQRENFQLRQEILILQSQVTPPPGPVIGMRPPEGG